MPHRFMRVYFLFQHRLAIFATATMAIVPFQAVAAPARSAQWTEVLERCSEATRSAFAIETAWINWKVTVSNNTITDYCRRADVGRIGFVPGVAHFHVQIMCRILFRSFVETQCSNHRVLWNAWKAFLVAISRQEVLFTTMGDMRPFLRLLNSLQRAFGDGVRLQADHRVALTVGLLAFINQELHEIERRQLEPLPEQFSKFCCIHLWCFCSAGLLDST